jgi:hypothetical protein
MPKSKCPTKWKQAHPTKAEAEKHAAALRRKNTGAKAQAAYLCPSGEHWHVGNGRVWRHQHQRPSKRRK